MRWLGCYICFLAGLVGGASLWRNPEHYWLLTLTNWVLFAIGYFLVLRVTDRKRSKR